MRWGGGVEMDFEGEAGHIEEKQEQKQEEQQEKQEQEKENIIEEEQQQQEDYQISAFYTLFSL